MKASIGQRIKDLRHAIAHKRGWIKGKPITWREGTGYAASYFAGFQCSQCGRMEGVHKIPDSIMYPERKR